MRVRPILRPGLRVLRRDAETVQIGAGADASLVIEDCPELQAVLSALDGVRDEAGVVGAARSRHVNARTAASTLTALQDLGVIADADDLFEAARMLPTSPRHLALGDVGAVVAGSPGVSPSQVIRRRRRARIDLIGLGAVGTQLAWLLAVSGAGVLNLIDLTPVPPAPGAGRPTSGTRKTTRQGWVRDSLVAAIPWTTVGVGRRSDTPDLAIVTPDPHAGPSRVDPVEIDDLTRAGAAHLVLTVHGTHVQVGPLVIPGRTPCLRCLDLTNADKDPAWPLLVHQLAAPPREGTTGWIAVDPVLVAMAAACAAGQALRFIQGLPASTAHEVIQFDGEGRQSALPSRAHPGCGCGWDRPATMGA
jgi:bacteriocin biosynthesis cyclodehydratase domain-containing protein